MTHRLAPASLHRRMVGVLLCAMLLMQVLGLLHGISHVKGPLHAAHEGSGTQPHPSGLEGLFAQHDSATDCQVFDQLSHADALGFAWLDPSVGHPALPRLRARPLPHVAAQVSGAQARGPPALA